MFPNSHDTLPDLQKKFLDAVWSMMPKSFIQCPPLVTPVMNKCMKELIQRLYDRANLNYTTITTIIPNTI